MFQPNCSLEIKQVRTDRVSVRTVPHNRNSQVNNSYRRELILVVSVQYNLNITIREAMRINQAVLFGNFTGVSGTTSK